MQSRWHAKYFFKRIRVGSFDGVCDFNADLCKNIAFNQKSDVVVFFLLGEGGGFFGRGQFFRGRYKGFSGEWVGGTNCLFNHCHY